MADDRATLLAGARAAALRAYAPYSHFRVGAVVVVLTTTGPRMVAGANVENAAYGLALCAERAALATACALEARVARGDVEGAPPTITHLAVACIDVPPEAPLGTRMPCGACRQWLAELAPDAVYYVDGVPGALRLADLLPHPFRLDAGLGSGT